MRTAFHSLGFWWHIEFKNSSRVGVDQFGDRWIVSKGWLIHEHNPNWKEKISELKFERLAA